MKITQCRPESRTEQSALSRDSLLLLATLVSLQRSAAEVIERGADQASDLQVTAGLQVHPESLQGAT
jgi:hypothetical protein